MADAQSRVDRSRAHDVHGLDRLAQLEEERRFLLRSLRDLDAEHVAGDVDDEDYATLRDGYTARAAAVLRELEAGRAALSPRRPRRWARLLVGLAAVGGVAVGAGWLVARSSGERLAGQQITGADPRQDLDAKLVQARVLTGEDVRAALALYDEILAEQPELPEALTYHGWLLYVSSLQADDPEVRELGRTTAEEELARAAAADTGYADPHCFLGVIAANAEDDVSLARREIDQCLALGPPAYARGIVEAFAERLDDLAGGGSAPAASAPPTTTG